MSHWEDDSVQFPRLLAEIMATQDNLDMPALAESMDVSIEELNELFDRADRSWESIKAGNGPTITLKLNIFSGQAVVVGEGEATVTLGQIADILDHAVQLVIVRRGARRCSGDTESILKELEEAVDVAGLLETFDALFADVIQGLKEYYPSLNNPDVVAGLKSDARKSFDATGNGQADYERLRDLVERLVKEQA